MQRYGQIIGITLDSIQPYREAHRAVWPEVLEMLSKHHISNYSIYHYEQYLFAYFEYDGNDLRADMERMHANPIVKKWQDWMGSMQVPLDQNSIDRWTTMEELFHHP